MARILFFVFVAFAVWLLVRVVGARRGRDADDASPAAQSPPPSVAGAVEPVAQCAWCGVHVPSGSAVSLPDGRIYCGTPHRDRARAAVATSDRG